MDRPKQIELIRWTIEEYSGFSCSIEAAESYLDDFNSICASDETQADRQNEQTKDICPKCKTPFHFVLGNFICPNFDCSYTK